MLYVTIVNKGQRVNLVNPTKTELDNRFWYKYRHLTKVLSLNCTNMVNSQGEIIATMTVSTSENKHLYGKVNKAGSIFIASVKYNKVFLSEKVAKKHVNKISGVQKFHLTIDNENFGLFNKREEAVEHAISHAKPKQKIVIEPCLI